MEQEYHKFGLERSLWVMTSLEITLKNTIIILSIHQYEFKEVLPNANG